MTDDPPPAGSGRPEGAARAALREALNADSPQALAAHYAGWAPRYEADSNALGFRVPALCAALFARYVPRAEGPVLDAGCGTGLAGDTLSILGYDRLTGIDLTPEMLDRAHARGVYGALHRMELGQRLDLPTDGFAGTVASGVFTLGHAPARALAELARVTRPGGTIVFNVMPQILETAGFVSQIEALAASGAWRLRERSAPFRSFLGPAGDVRTILFAFEVTG